MLLKKVLDYKLGGCIVADDQMTVTKLLTGKLLEINLLLSIFVSTLLSQLTKGCR